MNIKRDFKIFKTFCILETMVFFNNKIARAITKLGWGNDVANLEYSILLPTSLNPPIH